MGRRFGIGADGAFAGVLIAFLMNLWLLRGLPIKATSLAVGLAAPSTAGVGVILMALFVPSFVGAVRLERPLTYLLPAVHVSLTALFARAALTGQSAAAAIPDQLLPATLWLKPVNILMLFLFSWVALELVHRKNRSVPVS